MPRLPPVTTYVRPVMLQRLIPVPLLLLLLTVVLEPAAAAAAAVGGGAIDFLVGGVLDSSACRPSSLFVAPYIFASNR
jgi:hypothetical protein